LLTSAFVKLEVDPKVAFHAYPLQRALLDEFFMEPTVTWARDLNGLVSLAIAESERYGLAALDALHLAAALMLAADEFVTTEKPGKPIYRAGVSRSPSAISPSPMAEPATLQYSAPAPHSSAR